LAVSVGLWFAISLPQISEARLVRLSVETREAFVLDFGPLFARLGGVLTLQPPVLGPTYRQYVPKPDADGLDIAGVRPMQIRVPIGTNTGWNVRAAGHRPGNLCALTGSHIPFFETRAEREAAGDPRRSLEERYHTHRGFVRAVERAARDLVRERFLLQEDADRLIQAARDSNILQDLGEKPAEDDNSGEAAQ
jgi:Alpha/beta hydrolase domain